MSPLCVDETICWEHAVPQTAARANLLRMPDASFALPGSHFQILKCYFLLIPVFSNAARPAGRRRRPAEVMHLAVVACGDRLEETLTMIKSALLFSLKRITFPIFAEDPLAPQFRERVKFPGRVFTMKEPGAGAPPRSDESRSLPR